MQSLKKNRSIVLICFCKRPRWLLRGLCRIFFLCICSFVAFTDSLSTSLSHLSSLFSASPVPKFTNSQILSIFPQHPVGGSPYSPPPYPPTVLAWGQQGLLGNAPWPSMPTGVHSGVGPEAGGFHPGVMNVGIPPHTSSLNVSGNPTQVHPSNVVPDFLR